MSVYANCDFPLLDDSATIELVRSAVTAAEPFSLIRLGDGEGVVLSLGDDLWLEDLSYLHGHWGTNGVTLGSVAEVKRGLESAIQGADVIGLRPDILGVSLPSDLLGRSGNEVREFVTSSFHLRGEEREKLSPLGARRLALLHRELSRVNWSAHQRFCSAWIHWELLASGALDRILEEVSHVGLVTSRPELEAMVADRFDSRTRAVVVPDKFVEAPEAGRHVPDRYMTVRSELTFPEGTLVLVGAGIPGKVYCQWLKEAGCVAIDVGAVFDAWVGKASRPRVLESRFNVALGDRVPAELQLRPPISAQHRRLVPRWKTSGVAN
jgi:hypothetical protein